MSMRPYNAKQVKLSREAMYDIVRRPVITEKATRQSEQAIQVAPHIELAALLGRQRQHKMRAHQIQHRCVLETR